MLRRLLLAALIGAAGFVAGCGDDNLPATDPEVPVQVTESFSGTVSVNGAFTHPFTVAKAGSVGAQITALSPDETVTLGLSLGTWNGQTCQIVITNDTAKLQSTVIGTATTSGSLCVRLFDVGGLETATSYDVKVDHY